MAVKYKDYYSILGVPRNATEKEIRTAYRKLAREFHPDINPGSEEKFKEINEAYEALKDPEKRRLYDSLGSNWRQGQNFTPPPGFEGGGYEFDLGGMGAGGGFSNFFDILFGGLGGQGFAGGMGMEDLFGSMGGRQQAHRKHGHGTRGHARAAEPQNTEEILYLDLEEVASGVDKEVVTPSGKRLTVHIPKGVRQGAKVRLAGEGPSGRGDLLLVVNYRKHSRFKLEEDNLVYEAPVPVPDLVLGGEIKVLTLHGELSMKIPPGTQPGRLMRLKGQGLPLDRQGHAKGDLLVRPRAVIPEHPSDQEKALYEELRRLHAAKAHHQR